MARAPRPGAHEALLAAARDEFARHGLARARVEDVARRAAVSKGAFYLHFRTKEEAFHELVQRFLGALHDYTLRRQEVEDRVTGEEAGASAPPGARRLEAECALDAELFELLWRNRDLLRAVDAAPAEGGPLLADFRRRMRALVSRRILDRQRTGELRPELDPALVADVLLGTYEGLARRMIDLREKPDLAAWARSLLVLLYQGMLLARPADGIPSPARRMAAPRARRARLRHD